ncbi:hypothetical protein HOD30_02085 [Candidatus Peregrinibacteria bacterium]|jgi:hypothetical protein|nr:hypothetical protein [Candidatus Peregrinibacteria bacterium]MBT4631825.1 hypothetical protein [Candidatus Peregrinibacteria bacterium]MBT5517277.1 hypothetical protein [Candidatus Peregrinibacteria bacterium]MBT5824450.1 hypothetical protein [Candidatus Peregrinibacteria bacterium]
MTSLLQLKIDQKLKKAIQKKAALYGVPMSSLIRIVLVQTFLEDQTSEGNVFNARRDNSGKGIPVEDLISYLSNDKQSS